MYQKSRQNDKMRIIEMLNENKTKIEIVFFFILRHKISSEVQEVGFSSFRERESYFSLNFPSFGPSVHFGSRSKNVLRGEGCAWTQIL